MNVLLIDDPADLEVTVRAITAAIPSVVHAVDAVEAMLPAIRRVNPDVIVSNHAPPRYDAVEALRLAGDACPDVPIIVMVATPEIDAIADCVRTGAVDLVGKPTFARLRPAIIAALSRRLVRDQAARTAAALRQSEERFRTLAENFPAVLYLRRNDDRYSVEFVNEAVEKLTGYPRSSFLDGSITFGALCHPDDRAGCDAEIVQAMAVREDFCVSYRLRHRTRGWRWVEERGVGVYQEEALRYVEGFLRDVTEPRAAASRLAHDATHDGLTGLVNRAEFERRLERAVLGARNDAALHAVCYLDLDDFKRFNDEGGHEAGDAVLRQVGRTLVTATRARDTAARLGGDEFGLLLEHCSPDQARAVASNLLRTIEATEFSWAGRPVPVGVSIGVAPISAVTEDAAGIIRDADAACYRAKRRGGSSVQIAGHPDGAASSAESSVPRPPGTTHLVLAGTLTDLSLIVLRLWSRLSQRWAGRWPTGWRLSPTRRRLPAAAFERSRSETASPPQAGRSNRAE